MSVISPSPTSIAPPAFIARWYEQLPDAAPRRRHRRPGDDGDLLHRHDRRLLRQRQSLPAPRVDALTAPVVDLFQRAHALGVRHFVLTQDTHDPDSPEFAVWPAHCVRGTEEAETIPELRALPFSDLFTVIEKNSLHPALESEFDPWLDAHPELRTAIVAGDCTDLCVYQLAMHLRLRHNARNVPGVRVIVPANVVETFDLPTGPMPHPGDFFHQVFLYHMALNGIEVVRELT